MGRFLFRVLWAAAFCFWASLLPAHDLPLSYVDLRVQPGRIETTVEASAKNYARVLPGTDEAALLDPLLLEKTSDRLMQTISSGLGMTSHGVKLQPHLRAIEALPGRSDVRISLDYPTSGTAGELQISCTLFAADLRHRTFLNVYDGNQLKQQVIFDQHTTRIEYNSQAKQSNLEIVRQFLFEGIHHIFIGPDHILFIVGLLLLGGTIGQLLKIVTAFTIAHSITLVLATLNLVSPPPRLIEPAIALSIIFVGAHALLQEKGGRDWRLLFAFCFGLVHGFGFANVLREMALPRAALGWSLFSFNLGVEVGQACIVLLVTPVIALLYRRSRIGAERFVTASAFAVIFAGSFWFTQRLFGSLP